MNYKANYWTSELEIKGDTPLGFDLNRLDNLMSYIRSKYKTPFMQDEMKSSQTSSILIDESLFDTSEVSSSEIESFINYNNSEVDYTGLLKGYAIELIYKYIFNGKFKGTISFGHDIVGYDAPITKIKVSNRFYIEAKGNFTCFTSGNNKFRGDHILCVNNPGTYDTCTYISFDNFGLKADMYATKGYSDYTPNNPNLIYIDSKTKLPILTEDSKVYSASPFFCNYDIAVRDKMVNNFNSKFIIRPDLSESSKKFSETPTASYAKAVFDTNIEDIKSAAFLVFPKDTDDLGTLMEVGVASYYKKLILRYDYLTDVYTLTSPVSFNIPEDNILIKFDDKVREKAVLFGYLVSQGLTKDQLFYETCGMPDNIMLSESATCVEEINGEYKCISTEYKLGM